MKSKKIEIEAIIPVKAKSERVKNKNLINKQFNTYEYVCKEYHTKYGMGILQNI